MTWQLNWMVTEKTRQLGRYRLDRLLSRGGMGEIYLAHIDGAAGFRKQLVIKRILPHLASESEFVDRFIDEANIVVHLTHGNIVSVFDMGEADGDYFIAMEYVPGRDLRQILKVLEQRGDCIPAGVAAFVIHEVAEALTYAHNKRSSDGQPLHIIHRDVSPSNILISPDGVVKLTDFGIAKAVSKLGRSITGRLQGKFCYMSPEQASGKSVDFRSDIFSLATVAYELLTGVRPFEGDSDMATLEAVRSAIITPASALNSALPAEVDTVLERAFAQLPVARYESAIKFASDLRHALGADGPAAQSLAEALGTLFPDGLDAVPGGLGVNDVLALEVDRMLAADASAPTLTADGGRTRTATAAGPSLESSPRVAKLQPTPPADALWGTPVPVRPAALESELAHTPLPVYPRSRQWLVWPLLLALGALTLWVWPGLLKASRLRVECNVPGAQVLLDNHFEGICPVTLRLEPGEYSVHARLEGYHRSEPVLVQVERGVQSGVRVDLAQWTSTVQFEVSPGPGYVRLTGGDWLPTRTVDGELRTFALARGRHSAEFVTQPSGPEEAQVVAQLNVDITGSEEVFQVSLPEPAVVSNPPFFGASVLPSAQEAQASVLPEDLEDDDDGATRPRRFEVTFRSNVSRARIFIDGEYVGRGSVTREFGPDDASVVVTAQKVGYLSAELVYHPSPRRDEVSLELEEPDERAELFVWMRGIQGRVEINGERFPEGEVVFQLPIGERYEIRVEPLVDQPVHFETVIERLTGYTRVTVEWQER